MATLSALSDRLRAELGDTAKSFVFTAVSDGTTTRYQLPNAPVQGATLRVHAGALDVAAHAAVEEQSGLLVLDTAPADGTLITVAGTHFRYFTDVEIQGYINTAFVQHTKGSTGMLGSAPRIDTMDAIDEYPMIILASTMALYTLATDAAYDIDIVAPDGVHIPRSERYSQLMNMIHERREQYRELCTMLGVGMYKVEVFTFRRISRLTNRYVPVYKPQELDDRSLPQRIWLPIPNYGSVEPASTVMEHDITMYAGDDFIIEFQFGFDLTGYSVKSQIRYAQGESTTLITDFAVSVGEVPGSTSGLQDTVILQLTAAQVKKLPQTSYYDIQLTDGVGKQKTYARGKIYVHPEVTQ